MAKLFKTSLFGYKKKDVTKYIEEISASFKAQLDECQAEIDSLGKKRTELENRRAELEKERAAISEAIVSAHEKAEKIIADAREKAAKEEAEMQRQIVAENQKLIKIRRDIHSIRRNAIKTLSNLEAEGDETEE